MTLLEFLNKIGVKENSNFSQTLFDYEIEIRHEEGKDETLTDRVDVNPFKTITIWIE
jgi:hypothetical protein